MNRTLWAILMISMTTTTSAQLPECVKEKCDSILRIELGEDIYSNCVDYIGYECTQKLDTITDKSCEAYSRHSYIVRYLFSFPNQDNAFFKLGFVCTGFYGQMHVQSEYFLRKNQSDLPQVFKENGLKIVDYKKIVRKAYREDSQLSGGGVLALSQDKIFWVFSSSEPYRHPIPVGDEAVIVHTVWVDPYTGEIIGSQIRRQ